MRREKNKEAMYMLSGRIEIKRLRAEEVTTAIVRQINALLRHQHSEANQTSVDEIRMRLKSMYIVLAWSDDNVVGMIDVPLLPPLSHTVASVHNPIVLPGFDIVVIKKLMFEMILELTPAPMYNYVDYVVDEKDEATIGLMTTLGFAWRKTKRIYRLKR